MIAFKKGSTAQLISSIPIVEMLLENLAEQVDSDVRTSMFTAADFTATLKNVQETPNFGTLGETFTDIFLGDLTEAIEKADKLNWPQESEGSFSAPKLSEF